METKTKNKSFCDVCFEKGRKQALEEVYKEMTRLSGLEIPTVQDNWIRTVRWLEAKLKEVGK